MKRFFLLKILLLVAALFMGGAGAWAQETPEEEERSWVLSFIESQLSTPNRQIRLYNIEGSFSSQASIGEITIADRQGVWLRVVDAKIDWNRSELFLGRISINELSAARLELLRKPLPDPTTLPDLNAQFFSLPQLPVAVEIGKLSSPSLLLGEELVGRGAHMALDGALILADGNLTAHFALTDRQGPGHFNLVADYDKQTNWLKLDLALEEPENGILANLLALENHPAVNLSLKGEGEVATLEVDLGLAIGGETLLNGQLRLQPDDRGQAFKFEAGGALASLLPQHYQEFLGADTRLVLSGLLPPRGGLQVDDFHLTSEAKLDVKAQALIARDGFLRRLNLEAISGDAAQLTIAYGLPDTQEWHGHLILNGLELTNLEPLNIVLDMGGRAENLDDAAGRRLSAFIYGGANRVGRVKTDNIDDITVLLDMALEPGQKLTLNSFDVGVEGAALNMAGTFDNWQFDGALKLVASDISALAALIGEEAAGKLELEARGQLDLPSGAFDVELVGLAERLHSRQPFLNRLADTGISFNGKLKRDERGLHFDKFFANSDNVHVNIEGSLSNTEAALDMTLELTDMVLIDEHLRGVLTMKAAARGRNGFINLAAHAEMADGTLADRRLEAVQLDFNGFLDNTQSYNRVFTGKFNGQGQLQGAPLSAQGDIRLDEGGGYFDNLTLTLSTAHISGQLLRSEQGLFEGGLSVDIADLSPLASLVEFDGQGSLTGALNFANRGGEQAIDAQWQVNHPRFGGAHLQAKTLLRTQSGFEWVLGEVKARAGLVEVVLGEPAHITLSPSGAVMIGETWFNSNFGSVIIAGQIDETMALELQLQQILLERANLFWPQIEVQGEVDGWVHISGAPAKPQINFDLEGSQISLAALQQSKLEPLTIKAHGSSDGEHVELVATLASGAALSAEVKGQIALQTQALDIDVELTKGSLAGLSEVVKTPGLEGQLSLNGHISGTVTKPQAQFELAARQISSALLKENGLSPLEVSLKGRLTEASLMLENFLVHGPKGLHFTAHGQAPLSGSGVDMQAQGSVPLELGNRFLKQRGSQLSGLLNVEAKLSGALQNPQLSGNFTVENGQFIDPPSNAEFKNITLAGQMAGETIRLTTLSARSVRGGTVQGAGEISTNWAQGLPADIRIQLDSLRHNDGAMLVAMLKGNLNFTGPLLRDFELGGTLEVEKMEVSLPNLANQAQEIDIQHKNLDNGRGTAIAATLARAQIDTGAEGRLPQLQKRPVSPRLNLTIHAPARIFVRGRGLDSELGGSILLGGTVDEPRPSGSFNLIRGRFDILTKRLELEEGRITLSGTLDPLLDFTARTKGNGFDVMIVLRGVLSDLSVNFTSQPELPQDEALAFLLFNRSIGELSPLQIARLAASVAELTGKSGTSLMGRLRAATGLDDLDITSDEQGHTGVQAGRYIKDNIYLGVEADSQGQTRGSINLDITKDLKAKGSIDSDSHSNIGIFFERDY